jgi:hypothetical protein
MWTSRSSCQFPKQPKTRFIASDSGGVPHKNLGYKSLSQSLTAGVAE